MVRSSKWLACLAVGASLSLAACGSDDGGDSNADATTAATSSTEAAAKGPAIQQSTIDLAAEYMGATAGKADASLPPVKVGFTNQQGATPAFPEHEKTADATVRFINEHLGGVDGHPMELAKCFVKSEEDGQKCGAQFLNEDIKIGNQGLTVVGNESYFKTVGGKFPIIVSGQGGGADVTTKKVYILDPGGAAMIGNMASIAKELGAKTIAVVAADNPAGKFAIDQLLNPALKALDIKAETVFVADTGTTPDYASALQAAGAAKADLVFSIPANVAGCISVFDAMKQLAIDKKVVATYTCYGDPFPKHSGDDNAKWYTSGFTLNPRIEADPQAAAYREVMGAYGAKDVQFNGTALKEFQDLLLIARFGTELGFDGITPDAMDKAIQAYSGPGFLVKGTLKCDGKTPGQPGVCGTEPASSTFKEGAYVAFP